MNNTAENYKNYRYNVTLTLTAPIISQASGGISHGIDAAMLRNRNGNTPSLPGTLIRGNLRDSWQEFIELGLLNENKIKQWLGGAGGFEPNRGDLYFDEYWTANNQGQKNITHRIRIDESTGTVADGAYIVVESPWESGTEVEFSGKISINLNDPEQAEALKGWIQKGLMHCQALGAYKGIGYGDIKNVAVDFNCTTQANHSCKIDNDSFGVIITPNKAFCLSQHQRGNNSHKIEVGTTQYKTGIDNHFQSEDHITGAAIKGAAIKGAIATQLRKQGGNINLSKPIDNKEYPALSKHLDQLHISHAQPQEKDKIERPWVQPLSLVIATAQEKEAKNILCDVIHKDTAGLINNTAPKFSTDWKGKDWQIAAQHTNNPAQPERTLSIHTAIKENAAEEGQLYSIESVTPEEHHWLANITLPADINNEDKAILRKELARFLANGLYNIGKTAATASININTGCKPFHFPRTKNSDINALTKGEIIIITLQSLTKLLPDNLQTKATNDGKTLTDHYKAKFQQHGLELKTFFAEQQFIGGYYWHKRYNTHNDKSKPYNPQIFTKAGSVFRFIVSNRDKAQKALKDWQQYGIPSDNEDWKSNPYTRDNGYGEIAINLPIHWGLEPKLNDSTANWEGIS